jgi:TonB family protein
MKTLNTWTAPVAISLLLHAAVIALVTHQLPGSGPVKSSAQTITVALLGIAQPTEKKPQVQPKQPAKPEPAPIATAVPQVTQTTITTPEQTSTPNQESNVATESKPSSLVIQPLSKLTRPPAFLHKIDPVYPVAEQRAGSQANVLAEVTIDNKGEVLDVRIVKSAGKHFDEAVMEALKKSMFVPGYINKEAVAVRVLVPFRFNLR